MMIEFYEDYIIVIIAIYKTNIIGVPIHKSYKHHTLLGTEIGIEILKYFDDKTF